MAYSQFKVSDLRRNFQIRDIRQTLFADVAPVSPTAWLTQTLALNADLPIVTEKARSEWIIAPVLTDIWQQNHKKFSIHSGINLDAEPESGLNGECDFILSANGENSYFLKSPIFTMVEAKRDDFFGGIPQCAAQMLGAQKFNQSEGNPVETIYGCVTNGKDWLFLRLKDNELATDTRTYFISELPDILGVLNYIVQQSVQNT